MPSRLCLWRQSVLGRSRHSRRVNIFLKYEIFNSGWLLIVEIVVDIHVTTKRKLVVVSDIGISRTESIESRPLLDIVRLSEAVGAQGRLQNLQGGS